MKMKLLVLTVSVLGFSAGAWGHGSHDHIKCFDDHHEANEFLTEHEHEPAAKDVNIKHHYKPAKMVYINANNQTCVLYTHEH